MATTTNFGWETPDDTDLVKDGAAAIRTALGGVDTSFVDLKGGTTGQILSKASNTDLDYTWVTTDDANAIQNAIVDAKGDLIAATANDTPARLAVGANTYVVMADSSTATGLKYGGDWTTWTPTLYGLTLGNGAVTARYRQIGKTIEAYFRFAFGSTSAVTSGPAFSLPANQALPLVSGACSYDKFGVGNAPMNYLISGNLCYILALNASGTYLTYSVPSATVPITWGTNDTMTVQFTYEAA
jgi:hypothetical protein